MRLTSTANGSTLLVRVSTLMAIGVALKLRSNAMAEENTGNDSPKPEFFLSSAIFLCIPLMWIYLNHEIRYWTLAVN